MVRARWVAALLVLLASCSEPAGEDIRSLCERVWGSSYDPKPCNSTVEGTVVAYRYAIENKLLPNFLHLLHSDFAFEPAPGDSDLIGDTEWTEDVELGILANLFDQRFVGDVPAVDTISMELRIEQEELLPDNVTRRVVCPFEVGVLTGPSAARFAAGVLELDLVPSAEDERLFQIRRMHERAPADGDMTWGELRALYYQPWLPRAGRGASPQVRAYAAPRIR